MKPQTSTPLCVSESDIQKKSLHYYSADLKRITKSIPVLFISAMPIYQNMEVHK